MAKSQSAPKRTVPLGSITPLTDEEIDAFCTITDADIEAMKQMVDPDLAAFLNAESFTDAKPKRAD